MSSTDDFYMMERGGFVDGMVKGVKLPRKKRAVQLMCFTMYIYNIYIFRVDLMGGFSLLILKKIQFRF